mmetsp:Transcript_102153/g.202800  ORF Transcript_102153/g.202800 Transcript_102153/m.202800 type:complete len:140 (-) Transcript_102153:163-582(-)
MQLICIARALLQRASVLVMDEATANIDAGSDEVIQRTLQDNFAAVTVLTIAHRLSTIAHSTKIAVMEQGKLVEFGAPWDLAKQGGLLSAFFQEAGVEIPSGPNWKERIPDSCIQPKRRQTLGVSQCLGIMCGAVVKRGH